MSALETARPRGGMVLRKPKTLVVAVVVTAAGALSAVAGGLVMLHGGTALAKEISAIAVADALGVSVQEARSVGGDELDGLQGPEIVATLQARGCAITVVGGVLLLFGLLSHRAAVWARVMVTAAAAPTIALSLLIALDTGTTPMLTLAAAAAGGSVAAIVLSWLAPTNRYARLLRSASR